jgi:hypothetical protein
MADTHPPAAISASEFFTTWLPEAYAAGGCQAPDDAPLVRVSITGPDGGEWSIQAEDARLNVTAGAGGAPAQLWIRQSAADFRATFGGDPDLPDLLPPGWGPLDFLFLDPRDRELLRQIDGRLLIEINGRRRRRWSLDLATGKNGLGAGRARATVRVDGTSYDALKSGSLPPLKALLEGRIGVEGDRALAMQALMLLGARLNRR